MPWKGGVQGMVNSVDPMYQATGKTILDPATLAGKNSWLAKESSYDPLMKSGAGKYIDPAAASAGQAYANRNVVSNPVGAFAGTQPTLANAQNQYLRVAQAQAQPQKQQYSAWS